MTSPVPYPPFPLRGQQSQCRACGALFRTVRLFERHRVGPPADRRCLDDHCMTSRGWTKDAKGFWRGPERQKHADRCADSQPQTPYSPLPAAVMPNTPSRRLCRRI
jgi:hypothetical protein